MLVTLVSDYEAAVRSVADARCPPSSYWLSLHLVRSESLVTSPPSSYPSYLTLDYKYVRYTCMFLIEGAQSRMRKVYGCKSHSTAQPSAD